MILDKEGSDYLIYIVSDVHGCYSELMQLLKKVKFNDKDTLIIAGDIIDRGKENIKMIDFVMNSNNVIQTMGNHEYMMIDWLKTPDINDRLWLGNGGDATLKEITKSSIGFIKKATSYISKLPYYYEIAMNGNKYVIAHAYTGDLNNNDAVIWGGRIARQSMIENQDFVSIVGHLPTVRFGEAGKIKTEGNLINIDCGLVYGYNLGMLRLDDMVEFYL